MNYQDLKAELLSHLIEKGYIAKGRDAVYKIVDGSFILLKPRKHTIAPNRFFVDFGIIYQFNEKQKKPSKTFDCHLVGEFSNLVSRETGEFKSWDIEPTDFKKLFGMIDTIALPYIDRISKLSYIKNNYPMHHDQDKSNITSLESYNYLCSLVNLN